jgi:hypothetical protein
MCVHLLWQRTHRIVCAAGGMVKTDYHSNVCAFIWVTWQLTHRIICTGGGKAKNNYRHTKHYSKYMHV